MPGQNGAGPDTSADPTGVFGRVGREFPLGDATVRLRLLANRDMKAQLTLIQTEMNYNRLADDGSVGELYYAGALGSEEDWARLVRWLGYWTEPPVTAEMLDGATPEQTVALIDGIFAQSGMDWLRRTVGNLVRAYQAMVASTPLPTLPARPDASPASDSTLSTNSSSGSPDPPPTPLPTSRATD